MFEISGAIALSIFLTCSLFFTIYGLAYLGISWGISLVRKIKEKLNEEGNDKGLN